MDTKNELLLRVYVVLLMFILFALVIAFKIIKINVIEGDEWRAKAEQNLKWEEQAATRGDIYTEEGKLLSTSTTFFDIYMDLTQASQENWDKEIDSLSYYLTKYTNANRSRAQWKQLLSKERQAGKWGKPGTKYHPIAKNLDFLQLQKIRQFPLFRRGLYGGGFIVKDKTLRIKPFGSLAERTIGEDRENAQKIGIEGYFDKQLTGVKEQKLMKKIGPGFWVPIYDPMESEPKKGANLITTLDMGIQDIVHVELLKAVEKHEARAGTAIVMEVATGKIRAISNFKLNSDGKSYAELYNFGVGERSEPGSTFKLASVLALVEAGHANPDTKVDLQGGVKRFSDLTMKDSHIHGLREVTLKKAFSMSSNVGIASLSDRYFNQTEAGRVEFVGLLNQFGLADVSGVEIVGEQTPKIKHPSDKDWYRTTIPWMSHGYELAMSPLQVLNLYNTVANDGRMMKPYLVSEVYDMHGKNIKFHPKVVKERIASDYTISVAQELLEEVVQNGTAKSLQSEFFDFAGKTGTARFGYADKTAKVKKYNGSFVGYFPAENPKYSAIVVIYDPKRAGFYGGTVAGPVFKAIAEQCSASKSELIASITDEEWPELTSFQKPNYSAGFTRDLEQLLDYVGLDHSESDYPWAVVSPGEHSLELKPKKIKKAIVPNVKGMGLRDATFILENLGLKVVSEGYGKVIAQSLMEGVKTEEQTIEITLN